LKFKDSIGIDIISNSNVDIVHDLNMYPWPFEDNSFDRIIFKHSISHMNNIIDTMNEVYRILRKSGIVDILAPHFSSDNYFTDPTHNFSLGYRSMYYFCDNIINWKYKYTQNSFKLVNSYISFREYKIDFNSTEYSNSFNPLKIFYIEWLINKCPRIYEKYFSNIFTASEVFFRLKYIK
jgi:ubiquinone/menaquinone biosynthesis C-methylase UbiE